MSKTRFDPFMLLRLESLASLALLKILLDRPLKLLRLNQQKPEQTGNQISAIDCSLDAVTGTCSQSQQSLISV